MHSTRPAPMLNVRDLAVAVAMDSSNRVYKRDDGAPPLVRGGPALYIHGAAEYETALHPRGDRTVGFQQDASSQRPVLLRGATQYPDFVPGSTEQGRVLLRGATQYADFVPGFADQADNRYSACASLDDQMGECLEGLLQLRETRDLVVMTMNMQHFATWPKDPDAGYYELCRITEVHPPPDIICVQEGLAGIDQLSDLGYRLLASTESSAESLRQALYMDVHARTTAREAKHDRQLVNELYVRAQSSASKMEWEVVDHGAQCISSKDQTSAIEASSVPLAARSVVWAKLRHRTRPEGPFAFLLNTQLSGGSLEDSIFPEKLLEAERRKQVANVLQLFDGLASEDDLAIFVGELGSAPDDHDEWAHQHSPFGLLRDRDWRPAYGLMQVGPTCSSGRLVDHMVTSKPVPALVKVFATTNQTGANHPPVTQVPLSDHNVVKATFSVRYPGNELDESGTNGRSPPHFYIGDEEGGELLDDNTLNMFRRKNFPLAFRPDPNDTSYVGMCARYEFECQDLLNERTAEQQAMEDITAFLSEQMWRLRDQCSDQIQGKSVLIQTIHEANDSVITLNESWAHVRAVLQAEMDDERRQVEQIEADFGAEEAEVQRQVNDKLRQLDNMRLARRSLGKHKNSMAKIKDDMQNEIAEERRMKAEIAEEGHKQLLEWTDQQQEIREELMEALAEQRADRDARKAHMDIELHRDWAKKEEVDAQEAELEQSLRRAYEEMSQQGQELRAEVSAKANELEELSARIQEVQKETCVLEDTRPAREDSERASISRAEQLRQQQEDCQAEISILRQDCIALRANLEGLKESEQATQMRAPKSQDKTREELRSLEKQSSDYKTLIENERLTAEDLREQLQQAEQRKGIFSCFFPKAKAKGSGPQVLKAERGLERPAPSPASTDAPRPGPAAKAGESEDAAWF